ncbi:MAG TPA: asparaginase [Galbitalea sp.]
MTTPSLRCDTGTVTAALDLDGCVELARVERSGMVESRHVGAAALVGPDGSVVRSVGNTDALIYPRSTLKPLQAVAVLRAGAPLAGAQLVLASASHAGSPAHLEVVRSILREAGLPETALQCPVDWPLGREYRDALVRSGEGPTRIQMNCSGKHAAFLLACIVNNWSTEEYLGFEHPLQLLIRQVVTEFTNEPVEHSGTDGCGAPVHAVTLAGLARGIGRISGATSGEGALLASAIRENPWAIDGIGRANTLVIEELGLIAKLGAEGVLVLGASSGTAVAVKILDGSLRAATLVALELLISAGEVSRAAANRVLVESLEPVLGGGRVVGAIVPAFEPNESG